MCGPPSAFSINSASSDISDRAPLLARIGDRGRAGPAAGKPQIGGFALTNSL